MKKVIIVIAIILSFAFIASTAMCENGKPAEGKKSFTQWLRDVLHYPTKVTNKTSEVVADSAKKTVDTAAQTVDTTTNVLTGEVKEADKIIMTPAQGAADVITETTEGVVTAPVDAAKQLETTTQ